MSQPSIQDLCKRFLRYVQIDTTADPKSTSYPSSMKQKDLGKVLHDELQAMGLEDVDFDQHGLVYATLPSNVSQPVPTICFCAHMDTSPDSSGTGVKPIIHQNYQGGIIPFPDNSEIKLDPAEHPELKKKIGHDVVTASGTTLLGADNKSGIAAIMQAMEFLQRNPEIPHGRIRILFTCDEEIGRGTAKVDLKKLDADIGYTIDGEAAGSLENETFSADYAVLAFYGVSAHPGFAKGKLINAIKLAAAFVDALPKEGLSPETTSDKQGFIHPTGINGKAERAEVQMILRDFDTAKLKDQAQLIHEIAASIIQQYPGSTYKLDVQAQYRNMREVLDQHPKIIEIAEKAIAQTGLNPQLRSIRGGTDGSRLSEMGLPCPNIFAGEHAFHSKLEWCTLQDMQKSAETIVNICRLYAENE